MPINTPATNKAIIPSAIRAITRGLTFLDLIVMEFEELVTVLNIN
jgi:hypothetical protein